jgi:hypothetical protein
LLRRIVRTAKREDAAALQQQFKDHPQVVAQLGGLDTCEPNLSAEFVDSEYSSVYDVSGPSGSGQIMVSELFGEQLSVVLRTDEGQWELLEEEPEEGEFLYDAESDVLTE